MAVCVGRSLLGEKHPHVVVLLGRVAGALGAAVTVARRLLGALLGVPLLLCLPVSATAGRLYSRPSSVDRWSRCGQGYYVSLLNFMIGCGHRC
jgi:hypothetical protein